MKKLGWSAVLGVPVCVLYWIGRLSHSSGPTSDFWINFIMFFLMPGYYLLGAINGLWHITQVSQEAIITLMIVFDCVFWSLVVLLLWGLLEKVRGPKRPVRSNI